MKIIFIHLEKRECVQEVELKDIDDLKLLLKDYMKKFRIKKCKFAGEVSMRELN